ncbi:beta-N-acetylhexosaminidase [Flavivirga spongiicola]|uniref:beta-N-acetylhexosaminidase n=1 Tax=Flavivirga spongiicola TaxID=421621 RepID=A0ABU7XQT4_9FLAO|nr:family 20 glycosylhydrolase [Flavivirga sp. MEBiC05379]MDO5977921.1 family 20 glycosylhydrolase [Flavivirga sp. MEBiC05379]
MITINSKGVFKLTSTLILSLLLLNSCEQKKLELQIGKTHIIPQPISQIEADGYFEVKASSIITVENEKQKTIANQFFNQFEKVAGWTPQINIGGQGDIRISTDKTIKGEGYNLKVTTSNITIKAASKEGFFYALQSLKQLLPVAFYKNTLQNIRWGIPTVDIKDYPTFGWRGYMLDVSRHFFTKEQVKRVIDFMSELKLNRFHWHLADDQGWRLEIKSYPKLTEIGAWRVDHNITDETKSNWWGRPEQKLEEKATYGGFYTQEDVKEIIAYAKERCVEIIPEIDMPGHAQATIAAYPEIGCVNAAPYVATGGVHKNNTYNPGKEETFQFAERMLNEVMDLFPYKYVHIGGDECNKEQWKVDPFAQQRMKDEKLKDELELQSYFIKRVETIINKRNRIMIGWDEILEGGLAPNATVMSWRGEKGGITSTKAGHEVIMTPSNYCYIDLKQGHDDLEPNLGYSRLLLSTSYNYKVIPDALTQEEGKLIKGIQANMWTESIGDWGKLTYMTFPRTYAIAESAWTPHKKKNWNHFVNRLYTQFSRLDAQEVRYAVSAFSPWIDHVGNGKEIEIQMKTEANELNIHYTLDGTKPTLQSPKYGKPFTISKTSQLQARAFNNDKAVGYLSSKKFSIHKAKNAKVFDRQGKKIEKLTDLSYGSLSKGDRSWYSFSNKVEVNVLFDKVTEVKEIEFDALRFTNSGIYPPTDIEVFGSVDGKTFKLLVQKEQLEIATEQGRNKVNTRIPFGAVKTKILKIKAKGFNTIPDGHRRSGAPSRIWIDEIIVN